MNSSHSRMPSGSGPWPGQPTRHPHAYGQPRPLGPHPHQDLRQSTGAQVDEGRGWGFRYVLLACVTLVALAGLVLAGLLWMPRDTTSRLLLGPVAAPAPVVSPPPYLAADPSTVTVPAAPSYVASGSSGGYSCGSVGGHAVSVLNGTVPCAHALSVAGQWLSSGTTPGSGQGAAGTMYSWSCISDSVGDGYCTSKMGSHLSIGS